MDITESNIPAEVHALYERAMVIDALASPDTCNIPLPPPGVLTPQKLANIRRSGIKAVHLTVGGLGGVAATLAEIGRWQAQIAEHPDHLMQVRCHADLARAASSNRLGLVFGFQGLAPIGEDLEFIGAFRALGVQVMQLTYNARDLFGSGCADASDSGLTAHGQEAVRRMNELGVLVDVSHASPRTAMDAVLASAQPIAITHTGARAVHAHPRNQPDEVLRAVAQRGGVVGIYLMPFLGRDPQAASRALVLRHLRHALDVCGEDHVGIGSDQSITPVDITPAYMDVVAQMARARQASGVGAPGEDDAPVAVPDLNSPRRLEIIAAELSRAGYPARVIEKILGANFSRLFRETWLE